MFRQYYSLGEFWQDAKAAGISGRERPSGVSLGLIFLGEDRVLIRVESPLVVGHMLTGDALRQILAEMEEPRRRKHGEADGQDEYHKEGTSMGRYLGPPRPYQAMSLGELHEQVPADAEKPRKEGLE